MIQYIISGVWLPAEKRGNARAAVWRIIMGFFSKLFDPNAGEIKRLQKIVDQIDAF